MLRKPGIKNTKYLPADFSASDEHVHVQIPEEEMAKFRAELQNLMISMKRWKDKIEELEKRVQAEQDREERLAAVRQEKVIRYVPGDYQVCMLVYRARTFSDG